VAALGKFREKFRGNSGRIRAKMVEKLGRAIVSEEKS
jgi:hypothetical protein